MIPFVDIHTHFAKPADDVVFVQNFSQNDWENASHTEGVYFASVGLHPWFLVKENAEADFKKLSQLVDNQNIIVIGECGLDKVQGASLDLQTVYFQKQIELAERIGKPVIIHCVRAFNEVIHLKKQLKPTVPLIIHGFNKNETVLQELLKNGFYISIGAAILRGSGNFRKAVLQIPTNRLFFETDDKDVDIRLVYSAYCEMAELDLSNLKSIIYENFKKCISKQNL